jgi:uncharacterized membrane protein
MARKMPVPKNWDLLNAIKDVRYQCGSKHEMHKTPLHRGMLSRSSVRWYLGQCNDNPDLAAWMGVVDRELILSCNVGYRNELLAIANGLLTKYGKLSTVWSKVIATECDNLHNHILAKYEYPRLKRVEEVSAWVCMLDPDEKLYKYKWKEKSKKVGHSRSCTKRLIKRIASKLLDKYGLVQDNTNFRAEHWGQILNFEDYVYKNAHKGYDSTEAIKLFE